MATVRKRGERWQVIVQVRRPDGTRTSNAATFDTEDEARLHAHRLEYAVRSGGLTDNRATVAEVADTWLALQRHAHHATLDAYRHAIARAVRALGRVQARQLATQQCDIAWAQMLDTHAPQQRPSSPLRAQRLHDLGTSQRGRQVVRSDTNRRGGSAGARRYGALETNHGGGHHGQVE